jgi:hypothetical protein
MTKRTSRRIVLAILVANLFLGLSTGAWAQTQTVNYKEVHYQFTMNNDGTWVRRGLTILDSGEVATYTASGKFVQTDSGATISGEDTTTFDDGSSWSTKFEGQFSLGPKGLWIIPHKGEFTGGTGRFEGIEGTLEYTSKQISTDADFAGFAETEGTATYSLPQ